MGCLICDHDGHQVTSVSLSIGHLTSVVVKLCIIRDGLQLALSLKITHLLL